MDTAKDLVRQWVEIFNRQDYGACARIAAAAYVEHALAPFGQAAPGAVDGPAHLRQTAEWLIAQYPDITMTIETIVTEGDIVAA
ncbi:MAG: nuclear transport factor 2 family protein, partial [Candidatus Limnocylindrales bacterium]